MYVSTYDTGDSDSEVPSHELTPLCGRSWLVPEGVYFPALYLPLVREQRTSIWPVKLTIRVHHNHGYVANRVLTCEKFVALLTCMHTYIRTHTRAGADADEWVKLVLAHDPNQALDWGTRNEVDWGGGTVGYIVSVVLKKTDEAGGFKFRADGETLSFSRDDALGLEYHCGNLDEGNEVSLLYHPSCTSTTCSRPFVKNDDSSLSPRDAPHLVLGWATVDFRCGQASTPYTGLTLVPAGSADRVVMEGIKHMLLGGLVYMHARPIHLLLYILTECICTSTTTSTTSSITTSNKPSSSSSSSSSTPTTNC